jgi:urea transport system permease protein
MAALALAPVMGRAQSVDEAFAALASPSFETIRQGVGMLAVSGHPQAAVILSALQANRLFVRTVDKTLFIKGDDGSFVDVATGKPAADVMSGLKPVRVNNAVRGGWSGTRQPAPVRAGCGHASPPRRPCSAA